MGATPKTVESHSLVAGHKHFFILVLPRVGHTRLQRNAAFISGIQVDPASLAHRFQHLQAFDFERVNFRMRFAAGTFSHSFIDTTVFRLENDANRFIVCRAILRLLLSSYAQTPARKLFFAHNAYGKPQLRSTSNDENEIHFNVSHAGNYSVFAFANSLNGIDIEYSMSTIDINEIAAICLTPSELENWRALPESQQRRHFFEIWTAKEAYLKRLGCGLSTPMNELHLGFADAPDDADSSVSVFADFVDDGYVVAMACSSHVARLRAREISSQFLLQLLRAINAL